MQKHGFSLNRVLPYKDRESYRIRENKGQRKSYSRIFYAVNVFFLAGVFEISSRNPGLDL